MNSSSINMIGDVPITQKTTSETDIDQDIFSQIKQLDKAQYDMVHSTSDPHAPFFGQFYVNSLNDLTNPFYK